jgi:hypothetical protein
VRASLRHDRTLRGGFSATNPSSLQSRETPSYPGSPCRIAWSSAAPCCAGPPTTANFAGACTGRFPLRVKVTPTGLDIPGFSPAEPSLARTFDTSLEEPGACRQIAIDKPESGFPARAQAIFQGFTPSRCPVQRVTQGCLALPIRPLSSRLNRGHAPAGSVSEPEATDCKVWGGFS